LLLQEGACRMERHDCMLDVSVEFVLEAVKRQLAK
jgi:hypothetical protein